MKRYFDLEDSYSRLIARAVMGGDVERARRCAAEWAQVRDGLPTLAERSAGVNA